MGKRWSFSKWLMAGCPAPPDPPEPRIKSISVDGRTIEYTTNDGLYAAIAALVEQNTKIMRHRRAIEAKPVGPMPKMEPGGIIKGVDDKPSLFDVNRRHINALMKAATAATKGAKVEC